MKRPEQHITDSEADAIFRSVFAEWGVNGSDRDYGVDYIVEVFCNKETTGLLFNGQLKGSRHTEYSSDGTFISQVLEQDAADYLARQLRQPTFLFHADVNSKKLFWSAIQLDQKLLDALQDKSAKSMTVRIPTRNILPAGMERFLQDLSRSQTVVVSRILLRTKPIDLVEAMVGQPIERMTEVAKDMFEMGFRLNMESANQRRQSGDVSGARHAFQQVVAASSLSGYVEVQFNATIQLGDLEVFELMRSDGPQALVADKRLAIALELCRIAKRTPRHLHLFAQMTRKAAELDVAIHKCLGLLMIWRGHKLKGNDPVWLALLSSQLQQSLLVADRKYGQSLRLALATARSRFRWITSRPIVDVAIRIGKLAALLDSCDLKEAGLQYYKSAFELVKFAAAIATENRSMDELFHAVMDGRTLERERGGEVFQWVRSIVDRWPEESKYRKNAEQLMQRAIARLDGAIFEGDIKTTSRQIHYNVLTSAGIDPIAEPWASRIELAIRDEDPTRVLRGCQHKTVMRHPRGDPTLDRLALENANPKIIMCDLHRYALGGQALDDIDRKFKARFCDACLDKAPRQAGWTFDDEPS